VGVGIDQPRHQRPAIAVDDERAGWWRDRSAGDARNRVPMHQDVRCRGQVGVDTIEDPHIPVEDR
jgi:hypothetical protein